MKALEGLQRAHHDVYLSIGRSIALHRGPVRLTIAAIAEDADVSERTAHRAIADLIGRDVLRRTAQGAGYVYALGPNG